MTPELKRIAAAVSVDRLGPIANHLELVEHSICEALRVSGLWDGEDATKEAAVERAKKQGLRIELRQRSMRDEVWVDGKPFSVVITEQEGSQMMSRAEALEQPIAYALTPKANAG